MNLKQKIYNKHILLYNHDKDVFNYDYLAAKLPETMFSVEDTLELSNKYSGHCSEIDSCSTLPKLQSLRRRNLNILSALRENVRAISLINERASMRTHCIRGGCIYEETYRISLNKRIKDKIVQLVSDTRWRNRGNQSK